ncbi:MAG: ATP-binding protein [Oscillospiraceae bacterium]|nr:ATP-binding protein [Oscillospiraceae bacterium]
MKEFNTTSACNPDDHYMVDIRDRIDEIRKLVDNKKYFTINRARQYGKTTTLSELYKVLKNDYIVLFLDFQGIDKDVFANGAVFSQAMARLIIDLHEFEDVPVPEEILDAFEKLNAADTEKVKMDDLFRIFKRWIRKSDRPVVLIIDEVDSASNNQVFLDFLAQLRDGYTSRNIKGTQTFHSVILAGVHDIKHLQLNIRPEKEHKLNSPWNIAADFDIDMSLPEEGIRNMLDEYEADCKTGMDTALIAKEIRNYTNGFPYFVSRICQIIDTKLVPQYFSSLSEAWTAAGVDEAVRLILSEDNSFFESAMGKLEETPELKGQLRNIILKDDIVAYLPDDKEQKQLRIYGFINNNHNTVAVSNRIIEKWLYNNFFSERR